jgi:N-acetylglucosamine-6-phosphate deacetylase
VVGAALLDKNAYAEIICDGHHVDPQAVKIMIDTRGVDQTVLITDAMRATNMADGSYKLGELDTFVKDGIARLGSGELAGSTLKLKDAIKNVVDWGIADFAQSVQMATLNSAVTNHAEKAGKLAVDLPADFAIFDDNLNLVKTYIDGIEVK